MGEEGEGETSWPESEHEHTWQQRWHMTQTWRALAEVHHSSRTQRQYFTALLRSGPKDKLFPLGSFLNIVIESHLLRFSSRTTRTCERLFVASHLHLLFSLLFYSAWSVVLSGLWPTKANFVIYFTLKIAFSRPDHDMFLNPSMFWR